MVPCPCCAGITTRIIFNRTAHVIGIDIGTKVVDKARVRSPHIRFEVQDGFDLQVG